MKHISYWSNVWQQFARKRLGVISLFVILLFFLAGVYAPFLASSKPIVVVYNGQWYFPLFRYLLYTGFYTKKLDLFFNLMIYTVPVFVIGLWKGRSLAALAIAAQIVCFIWFGFISPIKDPAVDTTLASVRKEFLKAAYKDPHYINSWKIELSYMTPYQKLSQVIAYELQKRNHTAIKGYQDETTKLPTLWQQHLDSETDPYNLNRREWLENESHHLTFMLMPLFSNFHWEDDAGGSQSLNQKVPWHYLTRIIRKDLIASLIFGIRITLVVGIASIGIALAIGVPVGAFAGYFGGKFDIAMFRLVEIWESMPTFFMLLLVVAMLQTKSIFIVIAIIGFFGWTGFCRYIRGEFFKQRHLPYIESCHAMGFSHSYIIFHHILPNAIPPLVTLLPFSIMAAITTEAGLSFLGLGEEGSCSWGVLMDEGRQAFPGESYLLWPPATLLTILLVAIAIVGDALRDAIDPKLQHSTD